MGHFRSNPRGPLWAALSLLLALCSIPAIAKSNAPAPTQQAILPTEFAGWQMAGAAQQSSQPQAADSANAGVLTEYGFKQFEAANYEDSGNKLSIRAIRFQDASGAFGAFTFYRRPGSLPEQIGRGASWDGSHVLFWVGNTLVDATFDHLTAMSSAELRELAANLAQPTGAANIAPMLPGYLPRTGLEADLTRYTLGSESYTRSGGVLPAALVGFSNSSAEAVTAAYTTSDGDGSLTVLEYPTPQFAAARLQQINAFLKAGNTPQAAWPQALADSHTGALLTRRSGPLVAITSGSFSAAAAHRLIDQVNYEAEITWNNPRGYVGEGAKVARLLLGIFGLTAIVAGAAILLGIFLGGGRALLRILRGKPASAMDEEVEFIRLKLNE